MSNGTTDDIFGYGIWKSAAADAAGRVFGNDGRDRAVDADLRVN